MAAIGEKSGSSDVVGRRSNRIRELNHETFLATGGNP